MFKILKKFVVKNWSYFIYGFLSIIIVRLFLDKGVINNGDISFPYQDGLYKDLFLYLFSDYASLNNLENFNRPFFSILNIITYSIFGADFSPKIILGLFIFFTLSLFHCYSKKLLLLFKYNSNQVSLLIGSIFFAFSPWILQHNQAMLFWLAYLLTPPFFYYAIRFLYDKKYTTIIISGLVLTLIGSTPQYFLFTCCFSLLFQIIVYFSGINQKITFKEIIFYWFFVGILYFLLNLNFILPLIFIYKEGLSINPGYSITKDMFYFFGQNFNFLGLITGRQSWVGNIKDPMDIFGPVMVNISRISFFIVIIIGLLKSKKDERKILYMLLFIPLIIILFTYNYVFLVDYLFELPIISWFFRDPSKVIYIYWFFISIGIVVILNYIKSKFIYILILTSIFISSFNQTYIYYFYKLKSVQLPNGYSEVIQYLNQNNSNEAYKTAIIAPYFYGMGKNDIKFETSFTWNKEAIISHINHWFPKPNIGYYHITFRNWENTLYKRIYPEYTELDPNKNIPNDIGENYLAKTNIKYLIYHNDIVGAQEKGNEAIEILKNETDLVFVKSFGDFVYLFKNPYVKPILYTANNDQININKINPTKYTFNGYSTGNYLYFAQTYDPFWILSINGKEIKPEKAFDIDLIKYNVSGIKNLNGEINYFPQKYYEIGLKISIPFFILLLSYLGYNAVRNKRRKNPKIDTSEKSV